MTSRLTSLLVALLLGSAAGVVVAVGPAAAAACAPGTGVTVVVGSKVSCDADGGSPATDNFRDTGHTLTPVDRQPGFVCQVDGAPSSANCVNTPPSNAYWGLFWSDGTSGQWVYASQGVGSLKVPAGGSVAFVFQDSGSRVAPDVDPPRVAAAPTASPTSRPKPTTKPTSKPTKKPASKPNAKPAAKPTPSGAEPTPDASTSATPTPSATASTVATSAAPGPVATDEPTAAPESADEVAPTSSGAEQDSDGGSGSLGWVAGILVVGLLAGMGAVLQRRRSAGGSS